MKFDWSSFGIEKNSIIDSNVISKVQRSLGVTFPNTYLDLVTYCDEASPKVSSFSYGETGTCISEFFSLLPNESQYTVSWYSGKGKPPNLPKDFVPIARDAGSYLICLNFKNPSVSVEIFDPNSNETFFVADNFDDFVNMWSE